MEGDDEFVTLRRHLRESLAVLGKKNKMWLRETERRTFRVMLVDKVRIPTPRHFRLYRAGLTDRA